jgi:hypothetical protein
MRIPFDPSKDDTPLIVNADAVVPSEIASKSLKAVPWGRSKVSQLSSTIEDIQLPDRSFPDVWWESAYCFPALAVVEGSRRFVTKRYDHPRLSVIRSYRLHGCRASVKISPQYAAPRSPRGAGRSGAALAQIRTFSSNS